MAHTILGLCTIEFYLPGVSSLKEKRSIIKSMLARLHNTFNVSAAEVDHLDVWQSATIAIVTVSNSSKQSNQVVDNVLDWIESHFPEAMITKQQTEIL